jgi:hypothetical protein
MKAILQLTVSLPEEKDTPPQIIALIHKDGNTIIVKYDRLCRAIVKASQEEYLVRTGFIPKIPLQPAKVFISSLVDTLCHEV